MTDKELEEKLWKTRKIERLSVSEGFGKAILEVTTTDGRCYQGNLTKLDIRLARLKGKKVKKK